jgi:hypothetical protein
MPSSRTGLLDFLGGAGAEFYEISGLLRVRGGGENRAAVVPQDFQPVGDLGGVIFAGLPASFAPRQYGTSDHVTMIAHRRTMRYHIVRWSRRNETQGLWCNAKGRANWQRSVNGCCKCSYRNILRIDFSLREQGCRAVVLIYGLDV